MSKVLQAKKKGRWLFPSPLIHFLAWPDTGPRDGSRFKCGTGYSAALSIGFTDT
jgi:hypothetical protein